MTPTHSRVSRWAPAGLILLALVAAVAAVFLRAEVDDQHDAADASQRTVDALEATRLQIVISSNAFLELTHQLQAIGPTPQRPASGDHLNALGRAADELAAMVEAGRVPDAVVPIADDIVDAAGRATADPGDLWALEETAYVSTTPSTFGTPESLPDRLLLAATLATSPSLVAIDALSLELSADLERLAPAAADYVDSTASIVQEDPGWFGPDRATPFVGGYLPGELLQDVDPDLLASVRAVGGLDEVWIYDQWLISRLDGVEPAPRSVPEIVASARDTQGPLVERLLDEVDTEIAAATIEPPGAVLDAAWIVLAGLAALAVVALAGLVFARTRRLAHVAFADPLTGTANRRRLQQMEQEWANGGGPAHASVAVLDLDRFKLINDSLGHAVGDHVLRRVGAGLQALADDFGSDVDEVEVIRLGGDEFAVIVSASQPQADAVLHERIVAIGGPTTLPSGESLDIGLSVGVVSAALPADLSDLLTTADLRAYEEKQRRRTANGAPATPGTIRA